MIQLDWTLAVAAAIFIFTWFALSRLLLRPLLDVTEERRVLTSGVFDDAQADGGRVDALGESYERRLKEERQAGFKLAEERRNGALGERSQIIQAARGQADALLSKARQEIDAQLEASKKQLQLESMEIAAAITDRVLGGTQH